MKIDKYQAIIFDMDGTLINSEPLSKIAWKNAGKNVNLNLTLSQLNQITGSGIDQTQKLFNEWCKKKDFNWKKILTIWKKTLIKLIKTNGLETMPFAKEALEKIYKKKKIILVTSSHKPITKIELKWTNLKKYFSDVITGDLVKKGKPKPDIYLYACKKNNLNPNKCLVIEDSLAGVKSAYEAGCDVIMIPDSNRPDEYIKKNKIIVLKSLKEII